VEDDIRQSAWSLVAENYYNSPFLCRTDAMAMNDIETNLFFLTFSPSTMHFQSYPELDQSLTRSETTSQK